MPYKAWLEKGSSFPIETSRYPKSFHVKPKNHFRMSTQTRSQDPIAGTFPDTRHRFVVLYAEWNQQITHALRDGCLQTLKANQVPEKNIQALPVPGSFELSTAAAFYAEKPEVDAVICLGCVIQGETRHFDFICQAVAEGLTRIGIQSKKPVIFGVLTTNTQLQALERAGGSLGNKGCEAAMAALQMLAMKEKPIFDHA